MNHSTYRLAGLALAAFMALSPAAHAQKLVGAQLDKAQIQTGQAVQVSIDMELNENPFCGMRVLWGDGSDTEIKVESGAKVPLKTAHTYTAAGDYAVKVEPRRVTSHLPCLGKPQSLAVKVAAPPAPAPAPAPAAVAAPSAASAAAAPASAAKAAGDLCPQGWKLDAKSVNKKTGAFSCTAKPGTAAPDKKLACPGDTGYFENPKRGQLGCRV